MSLIQTAVPTCIEVTDKYARYNFVINILGRADEDGFLKTILFQMSLHKSRELHCHNVQACCSENPNKNLACQRQPYIHHVDWCACQWNTQCSP